jgi:hypothetical protein
LLEPLEDRLLLSGFGTAPPPSPTIHHPVAATSVPDDDRETSSATAPAPTTSSTSDKHDGAPASPAAGTSQQHEATPASTNGAAVEPDASAQAEREDPATEYREHQTYTASPSFVASPATVTTPSLNGSASEPYGSEKAEKDDPITEYHEHQTRSATNAVAGMSSSGTYPGHIDPSSASSDDASGKTGLHHLLFHPDPIPAPPPRPPQPIPASQRTKPEEEEGFALLEKEAEEPTPVAQKKPAEPGAPESAETALLTPEAGAPLAGLLPVDLRRLEASADALFSRLANLAHSEETQRICLELAPWLVVAAAAAWEMASLSRRRSAAGIPEDPRMDSLLALGEE